MFYYTEWNQEYTYMKNTDGKHILSPLERCLNTGFPTRDIVFWQENVKGTRNASLAGDRYNWKLLLCKFL
jgi:hypothetical protein